MLSGRTWLFTLIITLLTPPAASLSAVALPYRILVVMSYDEGYVWEQDIKSGIQTVIAEQAQLRLFYMDILASIFLTLALTLILHPPQLAAAPPQDPGGDELRRGQRLVHCGPPGDRRPPNKTSTIFTMNTCIPEKRPSSLLKGPPRFSSATRR